MDEKAANFCLGIILSFTTVFGVVGNIVSYFIWTKGRRCKKLPGGIYLRALAISDTIALCIPATSYAIKLLTQHDPRKDNLFFCKLENVGRHFGLLVSSWVIVCFSIERTLAIFKQRKMATWSDKKRTVILMIGIFIASFLLNLPYGIVYHIMKVADKPQWTTPGDTTFKANINVTGDINVKGEVSNFASYKFICGSDPVSLFASRNWYHIWFMDFVLIFVVPFILIVLSNITVLVLIIAQKNKLQSQGSMKFAVTSRAVAVSVAHCITTGPFSILFIIPEFSDRDLKVHYFIARVSVVLAYMNHSLNYVLYSVFGTDFKRDCLEFLWKKSSVVHPETTELKNSRRNGTEP